MFLNSRINTEETLQKTSYKRLLIDVITDTPHTDTESTTINCESSTIKSTSTLGTLGECYNLSSASNEFIKVTPGACSDIPVVIATGYWEYVGISGCNTESKLYLFGPEDPDSLWRAQDKMVNQPECDVHNGSILMYSQEYSYSWGFARCKPGANSADGNANWERWKYVIDALPCTANDHTQVGQECLCGEHRCSADKYCYEDSCHDDPYESKPWYSPLPLWSVIVIVVVVVGAMVICCVYHEGAFCNELVLKMSCK